MTNTVCIPGSLEEALQAWNEHTRYLSGGTELNRNTKGSPGFGLLYIKPLLSASISSSGNSLIIGAGAVLQDIIDHAEVPEGLKSGCRNAASRTLRCMATIGGNIASARDDSYLLPVLAVYHAQVVLLDTQGGIQKIDVEQYAALRDSYFGAVITEVMIPDTSLAVRQKRFSRSTQGKASVTAAVSLGSRLRIFASASGTGLVRLKQAETAGDDEQEIAGAVAAEFSPTDDISGTKEYKQYLSSTAVYMFLQELTGKGGN